MFKISITMDGKPFDPKSFTEQVMADAMDSLEQEIRQALSGISSDSGDPLKVTIVRDGDNMTVRLEGEEEAVAAAEKALNAIT